MTPPPPPPHTHTTTKTTTTKTTSPLISLPPAQLGILWFLQLMTSFLLLHGMCVWVWVCVWVCVCVSRGWQYHLSGCCSPCPCPAGGHWVMGEDFLILPPWDTHTHISMQHLLLQRTREWEADTKMDIFPSVCAWKKNHHLRVSSDKHWILRVLKNSGSQELFPFVLRWVRVL